MNGRDLGASPLWSASGGCAILSAEGSRLLYLDHLEERGCELFRVACERDLEGVVAKYAQGTYQSHGRATSWLKIKNPDYSQMEGGWELFEPNGGTRRTFRAKLPLELRLT